MSLSLADLKYAASEVLLSVRDAYLEYQDGTKIGAANIQYVGQIVTESQKISAMLTSPDPETAALIGWMMSGAKRGGNNNLFGVIAKDAVTSTGIIAFRGTQKGIEWIDDFGFQNTTVDFGSGKAKVHRGFEKVWSLVRTNTLNELQKLGDMKRLIVTGHSLGAAIAELCALEIKGNKLRSKVECWTYSSPRVFYGTTALFDKSIDLSVRVVNPSDIVTKLPSEWLGFRHVAGGLPIKPNRQDAHSLMKTYQPGLEALIVAAPAKGVRLLTSENEYWTAAIARTPLAGTLPKKPTR